MRPRLLLVEWILLDPAKVATQVRFLDGRPPARRNADVASNHILPGSTPGRGTRVHSSVVEQAALTRHTEVRILVDSHG